MINAASLGVSASDRDFAVMLWRATFEYVEQNFERCVGPRHAENQTLDLQIIKRSSIRLITTVLEYAARIGLALGTTRSHYDALLGLLHKEPLEIVFSADVDNASIAHLGPWDGMLVEVLRCAVFGTGPREPLWGGHS